MSNIPYDHTHTPDGVFLQLGITQDGIDPCGRCGRTARDPHQHGYDCPSYAPHPYSIAAKEADQ